MDSQICNGVWSSISIGRDGGGLTRGGSRRYARTAAADGLKSDVWSALSPQTMLKALWCNNSRILGNVLWGRDLVSDDPPRRGEPDAAHSVMAGYWDQPDKTAEAIDAEG